MSDDRIIQPPPCAWCSRPATDHVHVATRLLDATPTRLYSWLCIACIRRAAEEKRVSQSDE